MVKEKSVGAVVFNKAKETRFLLLHYPAGHWGFLKGHVEAGENEEQTLQREIKEETGLANVEIVPGFRQCTKYFFKRDKETVFKEVIFYLVKSPGDKVRLSFEHQGFLWLAFEEAMKKLSFKNTKNVLKKAKAFLQEKKAGNAKP